MNTRERTAIETVAREFSATSAPGARTGDIALVIGRRRIAVDVAILARRGVWKGDDAKPRLRFDKVATRVIDRLRAACAEMVPDGTVVLVAITAPIRLASQTAAAVEVKLRAAVALAARSKRRDETHTIHGNRIRIRLVRGAAQRAPRTIGFVHNADTDPLLLFDMTRELLALSGDALTSPSTPPRNRWLVAISGRTKSPLDAYRYIYSQLQPREDFDRVVIVFRDGRVGTLTD